MLAAEEFHDIAPPVDYSHGNLKLELVWTVLTTILFVGLNLMGSSVWASQRFEQHSLGKRRTPFSISRIGHDLPIHLEKLLGHTRPA